MAFSVIASTGAGATGGNSNVTTSAINTTGADLILVILHCDAAPAQTLTDSAGNTWTKRIGVTALRGTQLFECVNPTTSATHTFSVSTVGRSPSLTVLALSGVAATPYDQQNSVVESATTSRQPGSVTPSEDNELLITGLTWGGGTETLAIDSSFTISNQVQFSTGEHFGAGMAYKIQTTAGAENPTWSWVSSRSNTAIIATYKAAAAGGTTDGVGSSSGTSTAAGTGASTHAATASSSGVATSAVVGASTATAVGSAAGVATVTGVAATEGSIASSSGTSTVAGVGASTFSGVASSSGIGAAAGVGSFTAVISAVASASGTGAAFGISPGAAVTYEDWIARSFRVNWYGIQGTVRREFTNWISAGGNIYYTEWPDVGETFLVNRVTQDGVDLTGAASEALSAGEFFHKRTIKPHRLYVRMSDDSNPYSKTVIGYFPVRFASIVPPGKLTNDLNDVPWQTRLAASASNVITQELANVFYGTTVYGSIKISLINADGYFNKYVNDWLWKESVFEFLHGDGGVELSYANHLSLTYSCAGIQQADDRTVTLTLESPYRFLEQPVLPDTFKATTYPNMDQGLEGKWIPALYGVWPHVPAFPIDLVNGVFKVTHHALDEISNVSIAGEEIPFTPDEANGELTIVNVVQNVTLAIIGDGGLSAGTYFVQIAALIRGEIVD